MNKHMMVLAATLLVILPGCWGRKQKTAETGEFESAAMSGGYQKSNKKSIFDEDVEGFVLEEGYDPFSGDQEASMTLVEEQDASLPDVRSSQATYGLKTVYFDFDKFDIRDDQKEVLDHNIKAVKNALNQGMDVVIEGHCDTFGSKEHNDHLSDGRARGVANYFIKQGIPAKRLKVVGRGCNMPIVQSASLELSKESIEQQAPNRRVEFYAIKATKE